MKKITIALDGYSSCGKSTIAKKLAEYAGYTYIDTGAMYRAVALYTLQHPEVELTEEQVAHIDVAFAIQSDGSQHVLLNGEDVESQIRTLTVGNRASQVAVNPIVRRHLVRIQQQMGANGGVVMDGRDIGTVVFPHAELKLFLTARPEVRAQRRYDELVGKGQNPVWEEVLADVNDRDYRDTHRDESPLRQAEDAIVVDNSDMTRDEQMEKIYEIFQSKVEG